MRSGLKECFTFLFGMVCLFQMGTRTSLEFLSVLGTDREKKKTNPNLFKIPRAQKHNRLGKLPLVNNFYIIETALLFLLVM